MKRFNIVAVPLTIVLLSMIHCSAFAAEMTISGAPPPTAEVGLQYFFKPVVKNANGQALQFNYVNKPSWSKAYRSSGLIMGTPTEPGVYTNIQVGAWDGAHYAVLPPFTITVRAPGTQSSGTLQITGQPAPTAVVGEFYSFTPTVVAPPGSSLTYRVANKPNWAQFSAATGTLSGTPTAGSAAVDANIVLSVSNGAQSAALPAFNIVVDPAAPTGTANLTWEKPANNTNGSPLTNLAGFIIRYGMSAGALSSQIVVRSATANSAEISHLTPGKWFFEVAAINTANVEGPFSSVLSKTIQ